MNESIKIRKLTQENERLKQSNASLRRGARKQLGDGYFGLNPAGSRLRFNHDEVIFMFAKSYALLGFEQVVSIQQEFPDCIAIKEGTKQIIEFEPKATDFKDHLSSSKHDAAKCNYIVCWENDINTKPDLKDQIEKHGIKIIELKSLWETIRKKGHNVSKFRYTERDFRKMTPNQQKIIKVFLESSKNELDTATLQAESGIIGKAIGGVLHGLSTRSGDWLVRQVSKKKFEFNPEYHDIAKKVIN